MLSSTLRLTRKPISGPTPLICIPGTYCSPLVFEQLDEAAFPSLQILPVSWMTSAGPWDIPALGRRVVLLIRELELGPALIIGHSTGGPIALMAALTDPSVVSGLVLVDTGANTHGHGDITSIIKRIEQGPDQDFFQAVMRRSFSSPPVPALLDQLIAYASAVPQQAALQALTSQASLDVTEALPQVSMPVLVIHGRADQARPIAHAEWLVNHLPHAQLSLFDCGHTPMVEVRSAFEQAVQYFWVSIMSP